MDRESINEQLRIEQDLLQHICEALQAGLSWDVEETEVTRKTSTVRFLFQAFQRHTQRLWAIHEFDGYMSYVLQNQPHMQSAVDALKNEHEHIRHRIEEISSRLDRAPDSVEEAEHVADVLRQYEECKLRESRLIQEAFTQDMGGEG